MADARSQLGLRVKIVDDSGNLPNEMDVDTGTAADAWAAEVRFNDGANDVIVKGIDVLAEVNPLEVRFVSEDGTVNDSFKVPQNASREFAFVARGYQIRNFTAGANADYEIIGKFVDR